jgi:putative hydrolase of HD superfamily
MKNLENQINFIYELDKLKSIYRQMTIKADNNRYENSAEHSWHVSIMSLILKEYSSKDIDINRVMYMLLIHDIIEIDAGDLFAFTSEEEQEAQAVKEQAAAARIFGLLGTAQFKYFEALWLEFEDCKTNDAIFAKAMDRIVPVFQNMRNKGGSWARHKISKSQVLKRNSYLQQIAPQLYLYLIEQTDIAVKNKWLLDK